MNQSQMTAMIHQQPAIVIVTTKLGGKIYVKLTVKNCGYTYLTNSILDNKYSIKKMSAILYPPFYF
jgi:hypothetical protein